MSKNVVNQASIPYSTWGGGTANLGVTTRAGTNPTSAVDNPYNIANLWYNCKINADLIIDDGRTIVMNMAYYAQYNIPNYRNITSIPEEHSPNSINTSLAKTWANTFGGSRNYACINLINLPDPFYDTSNATNMSNMFTYCNNLTTVPNFDTSNVTNMHFMFGYCRNLTTVPNFDTSNVARMTTMFGNCYNLTTVPNFDTSNVTDMSDMFRGCNKLTTVPNFDTSNVYNMSWMFDSCNDLVNLPNFNTSNVVRMRGIFISCNNLTTVPNFDTSNVTDMSNMFDGCYKLITVPNFDTSNVTDMSNMFSYCCLTTVPNFDTSNVVNMSNMFGNCDLTTVPNFDTSNVVNMSNMFTYCNNLTTVPNFDTSNVTDMNGMFYHCKNLTNFPIINISSKVNSIYEMFCYCYNIYGNLYIESNNLYIYRLDRLFDGTPNYTKNIYCHANTTTYNSIYNAMGNNTYNSNWNAYLKTMENDYAEISWSGNGIYRFPTNKIQMMYTDNISINIIEILPYTDYQLNSVLDINDPVTTYAPDLPSYINHNGTKWGEFAGSIKFRFFKDITNMTPDIVDPGITIQGLQDPNSEIYINNKKYFNPFYCEFEGEQLLEIYSPNYLFISQEINIPKNTSITVDVEQNREDAAKVTIIPSVSGANITYKYGAMTNYGTANDDGTFYVPKNTDIEYIVKLTGYKTVTNTINISEDTTVNITLEIIPYEDINITTPFTDNAEYLTDLVDDNNFEISGDYIQSGSSSYHKNNGTSYGYIQFTTPDEAYIDSPIEIECYVSSENNYDYAAVYIGTQVYEPSRTQIKNKTTDGNGEFIFAASGNGSLDTYTYNNLLPNTTYYLSFAYTKDSSGNNNSDRFFIKSIKFRAIG